LVAVVADGAGSAARAEDGARLACSLLLDEVSTLFGTGGEVRDVTPALIGCWLARFQHEVAVRAEADALTARDFACTVLGVVVGLDCAVFLQIGDGAIVVAPRDEPDGYSWIFWPQRGEYENQTWFATDDAAQDRLAYDIVEHPVDEVALFTDGLQRLALHFASQTAHAPFFRGMFAPLRSVSAGHAERLSIALAAFLDSRSVNDRTDDDKTLVLASRRLLAEALTSNNGSHAPHHCAEGR
jgi:hypothetical protein